MKITGEQTLVSFNEYGDRKIIVENNATLNLIDIFTGNETRNTIIDLFEGSTLISKTLTLGNNNVRIKVNHLGKNTNSEIIARNIVSKMTTFVAKSVVNKEASKAKQEINCLLLTPEAKIDAIPILDVKNNDVECSHGTTIGTLDAEMLFYMRSRGLNCKEAKNAVIQGYINPFLEYLNKEQKLLIGEVQ